MTIPRTIRSTVNICQAYPKASQAQPSSAQTLPSLRRAAMPSHQAGNRHKSQGGGDQLCAEGDVCPESRAILRGGRAPPGESKGSSRCKEGLGEEVSSQESLHGLDLRFPTCEMGITTLMAGSSVRTTEEGLRMPSHPLPRHSQALCGDE